MPAYILTNSGGWVFIYFTNSFWRVRDAHYTFTQGC